jgi:hypothetical protein
LQSILTPPEAVKALSSKLWQKSPRNIQHTTLSWASTKLPPPQHTDYSRTHSPILVHEYSKTSHSDVFPSVAQYPEPSLLQSPRADLLENYRGRYVATVKVST